jgi:hypothetical protein
MQKVFTAEEIRNMVIEIQDLLPLTDFSKRVEILMRQDILDENRELATAAQAFLERTRVPRHLIRTAFKQLAENRNYFYFNVDPTRGIFLHISHFTEVLGKLKDLNPHVV